MTDRYPKDKRPTFSIVVPIYNEEKFIDEALQSILAQTDPDWEALLVDDGSTDSTPGILDEYARKDPRIRVFHKSNGGQSTAINKGVQEAKGDWLCWLSGDDYFHPKKLELNRSWIRNYPDIGFFFSGFWQIEPDGRKIRYNLDWVGLKKSTYHLITLFRCNYVMGISICIKREAWLKNGEFDEKLRFGHDLDMWLRLMVNTPTKYMPDRTCTMRTHPGQESAAFPLAGLFDSAKSVIRLINTHPFKDFYPGVDLNDRHNAVEMLERALNFVATQPDANYYALGVHPLLQLRIMEWIWDSSMDPGLSKELQNKFRKKVLEMVQIHASTPFGLLWKAIQSAIALDHPNFIYYPCAPHKIGELNFYLQRAANAPLAQPLRTYLERYDNLTLDDSASGSASGQQLVLLIPDDISLDNPERPEYNRIMDICRYLIEFGYSLLLVGNSNITFGLIEGIPYLGTNNELEQKQLISSLGNLDTLITLSQDEKLKWGKANSALTFEIPRDNSAFESAKLLQKKIQNPSLKQQVIFIGYALWGGGVEKVLYELAHGLNPEIFAPAVLYFYEFINPIKYDPSIPTIFVESISNVRPTLISAPLLPVKVSIFQKVLNLLHVVYNRVPPLIREKINLRQRLHPIRKIIKKSPPSNSTNIELHEAPQYEITDSISEDWSRVLALRKVLENYSQDAVLISMGELATGILWLSQLPPNRKVVISKHVPYSWAQRFRYPERRMRQVKEKLFLNACREADLVAFPSEGARLDLINNFGMPQEKVIVLHNPIDCESIRKKSQEPLPFELAQKIKNKKTIFAQVARLSLEKAPYLLVEACDLLRKRYDDFIVLFVGDGPLMESMQRKIKEKNLGNHILLLGEKTNPYPYMAAARAVLLTSSVEGFGLVIAEAVLCGSVPISTDCIGPSDIIGDNQYGLLVPPENPPAFADAMYRVAHDDQLCQQLKLGALEHVWLYDKSRVVKEWQDLILKVAKKNNDQV